MNLSTYAIRHPVPPVALFLVLCVMGIVGFLRLPVTEMPNIDLPIVTVAVGLPGAAPPEMVSEIVQPIETQLADVAGIRHVTATATDAVANIVVQFAVGTDTDRALRDVDDAVTAARDDMPDSVTEPLVKRLNFIGRPILTYAIADPTRTIEELSAFVDDVVAPALQAMPGVGSVERLGGAAQEIAVELDPDRLLALGLTVSEVNDQIAGTNINLGGGKGEFAGQSYAIRTFGAVASLDALAATPIRMPSGGTVRLDGLGTIRAGGVEPSSFALFDGQPVVAFGVLRATGASDLVAARNAKARLATLGESWPNVSVSLVDDATVHTAANYDRAMHTLGEGALLAIVVVFLFLRDWRATVVTFVALPLSAIPTFIVMDLLGFTLNTISLLGITLVVGVLVDDAIVEIENIMRHIQSGQRAYRAAEEAATEIGLTVIAISLAIVAVFAPVAAMGGIAGQFFKQFGITVAVAVLFSLLVARLVTPMFAAYFLRSRSAREERDGLFMRGYLAVLGWTLRHKVVTLGAGVLVFAASIYSATLLPTDFLPQPDTGRSVITVELPPGSTIGEARDVAERVTSLAAATPDVRAVFVDGASATKLSVQVNYGPRDSRDRDGTEIEADIAARLADIPDLRIFVTDEAGQRDVAVNVLGDTEAIAAAGARVLAQRMRDLPMLANVSTGAALARPEIQITPRPQRAAELGITTAVLASTIRIATAGAASRELPQYDAGEDQIPIRVAVDEAARNDLRRLAGLRVPAASGALIPVTAVADIRLATGPAEVERTDGRYRVTVEADLAPGAALGPATAAITALGDAAAMPPGAAVEPAGDAETMAEVFSSFATAMGAGVLLVYVVLVLLFSSFVTPITILASLPLAIGGAIFGLYLYGAGIGLPAVIGFLMLMGIVTKNAIMLVDFALHAVEAGADRAGAMLRAGHKRARPIVMTTVAMSAGMIPSALGLGAGGEFRAPMAIALIGGLTLSTVLSLLFVPSLFVVVEALKDRLRRVLARMLGDARQPPAVP